MPKTDRTPSQLPALPSTASEGPLSFAIMQLAKAHRGTAAGLLRELGLYPGQELLLMQLWDRDQQTSGELVRAMNLDASTVTRMVIRLEEQGIVRREPSPMDGRAVIVALTDRGKQLAEAVRTAWAELERITTAGMSRRERDDLLVAIRRLVGHLASAAPNSPLVP
jgi:MarR family transcriptional regulator, organic hydroperoxide resistance regulator